MNEIAVKKFEAALLANEILETAWMRLIA